LAGHPPHIQSVRVDDTTVFSFNECPSVPKEAVRRYLTAIRRAKHTQEVLQHATYWYNEGRIHIVVPHPSHVPSDGRTTAYKRWHDEQQRYLHLLNIGIQSSHKAHQVVERISLLALAG
jgi:hypothetical protein